jgi:hypothetical protein
MQVTFNAKERTLREIVALALSAGWKVTKVTKAQGHILAVPVDISVHEDDDQGQNRPELAAECARSVSASAPAVVVVADADNGTGVREEPRIDTSTFAFALNVDLRSVTADPIPTSISTTTSAAAAATPAGLGHRSGRGWGIMRKASSPLVGRLRPRPSNMELNMGVESNSEGSGGREGLSESTGGGGRDDNINGRRGPTLKKKGSLGTTFPDSYLFSKSASLTILSELSFPHSSSLDYCFSHRF